jgi:hypothetical protein
MIKISTAKIILRERPARGFVKLKGMAKKTNRMHDMGDAILH